MNNQIRIFLVDDHNLMNEGLKQVIESRPAYRVARHFTGGSELLEVLNYDVPDLIITDISMPGMDGLELGKKILARFPGVRIMFLTMHLNSRYVRPAMQMGAHGYVLKDSRAEEVFEAIQTIYSGGKYLSPKVSGLLLADKFTGVTLTPREKEVLNALALGLNTREIAESLAISMHTIDSHRKNLLLKADCHNIAQLILWGVETGYVDPAARKG